MQGLQCKDAMHTRSGFWTRKFSAAAALLSSVICIGFMSFSAPPSNGQNTAASGAVFVGTNHNNTTNKHQPPNQIAMYNRAADGSLTLVGYFDTGGQGSGPGERFAGDGLGASHSVQLSEDHHWLFVTNAGSDDLSVFLVKRDGLVLNDIEPTGDGSPGHRFPNSVSQHGDLVYVLNSADGGSITGFHLSQAGTLSPLRNSTRELNANQTYPPDALYNPAQISITPDGKQIVVSIKDGPPKGAIDDVTPTGKGRFLVFDLKADGTPSASFTKTTLENHGPFGFSFDTKGHLLTALFVGGPDLTAAAGSFNIQADGTLAPISGDVPDTQLDSCWLENNGKYAWTANYTSGTISSFIIGRNGSLTLLDAVAGKTHHPNNDQGSTPLDMGISPDGKYLYNVLPGSGRVGAWQINADGSLTKIDEYSGLPKTLNGDHGPFPFSAFGSPAGIAVL